MIPISIDAFASGLFDAFKTVDGSEPDIVPAATPIGSLRENIDYRLEYYRQKGKTTVSNLVFYSVDVSDACGHQAIALIMGIFRSENCKPGSCFLLKICGDVDTCLLKFGDRIVDIFTSPDKKCKCRWNKTFKETSCQEMRARNVPGNEKATIAGYRRDLAGQFASFLKSPISSASSPYRGLCLGLVYEIAAVQHFKKHEEIPVAACIKFAIESDQVGELHKVFSIGLTYEERKQINLKIRPQEAKIIIRKYLAYKELPMTMETLEALVEDTKKFYNIYNDSL